MSKNINSFRGVIPFLKKKSLIVCDIDYTLVDYGKPFLEFLNEVAENEVAENEVAENEVTENEVAENEVAAYEAYDKYIHTHTPVPTDPVGFIQLMKEVLHQDCKLIFVTSRPSYFEAFTRKEFTTLNLEYDFFEVYYVGGQSKGEFCKRYITTKYDQIILIDDYKKNIDSFHDLIPEAKTFLFKRS